MKSRHYDAIVAGSGFGGCAAAYTLAKAGLKTVMVERGNPVARDDRDWNPKEILIEPRYRSDSPVFVKQYDDRDFRPVYANDVVGGMSVFYGGASMRLRETDFSAWPISYADLERHYGTAEQLLEVHGEAGEDPCEPVRSTAYPFKPIPFTPPAVRIFRAARELGYRPFKIPLAINFANEARAI